MSDVIDVICTLLLRKYPSIDAVYECTVPCLVQYPYPGCRVVSRVSLASFNRDARVTVVEVVGILENLSVSRKWREWKQRKA